MPGKLTYFAVGGRAFPIRAMCFAGGMDIEDCRVTFDDWPALKPDTPMGSMPMWEEDGFTMVQGKAILRMLAIRLNVYPADPNLAFRVDSMVEFFEGLADIHAAYMLPSIQSGSFDEEKGREYIKNVWDVLFPIVENRLVKSGKDWIGGTDTISTCDYKLGQLLYGVTDINPMCMLPPLLKADIANKIRMSPKFAAWYVRFKAAIGPYIAQNDNTPV